MHNCGVELCSNSCPLRTCRMDAGSAVSAEAMLGREVRILWQEDNAWFPGTITLYDSSSGQHTVGLLCPCSHLHPLLISYNGSLLAWYKESGCMQVLYADGDSESIFLPMERVRLNISAGEILTAPTSDEFTATAQHLLSAADADDDKAISGEVLVDCFWPVGQMYPLSAAVRFSCHDVSTMGRPDQGSSLTQMTSQEVTLCVREQPSSCSLQKTEVKLQQTALCKSQSS